MVMTVQTQETKKQILFEDYLKGVALIQAHVQETGSPNLQKALDDVFGYFIQASERNEQIIGKIHTDLTEVMQKLNPK